jgi:ribulose-5-phosphate 4-epimerase/fuculose-1-phosphate aldolase
VTPTGWSLRDVALHDAALLDADGRHRSGHKPSKEASMHLDILRCRPDLNVVCHVHGAFVVAASALLEPGESSLPPLCPGFVHYAYPLPMLEFLLPGSEDLVRRCGEAMRRPGRLAVLLQNHGLVAAGTDWQTAVNVAEDVDEAASIYVLTGGKARPIPAGLVPHIR